MPSRLFRHVAMAILEHGPGGYVYAVLLAPNLRFVDLPADELTHPESFHTTYTHHRAALWITRGRFHRRQMRQSWASTVVLAAPRPLPNGNTWDESDKDWAGMYGPLAPLLHPDHWVGPSTTRPPFQAPTTPINFPYPTTNKRPLLASGPLGGFSASSVTEVYPN